MTNPGRITDTQDHRPQWLSEREASVVIYFQHDGPLRLCDSLGYEELMNIRGLEDVRVEHVGGRRRRRCTRGEKQGLQRALRTQVLQPREEM